MLNNLLPDLFRRVARQRGTVNRCMWLLAIEDFKLNFADYPQSSNAYDGLAMRTCSKETGAGYQELSAISRVGSAEYERR
jgi:hypothetical protein